MPDVFLNVEDLASSCAGFDVPRPNYDEISLLPADHAVSVSGVVHISNSSNEFPSILVQDSGRFEVSLGSGNRSTGHIDFSANFYALLIP